jgi:ribosomal protein S18 acetylase RimI-like enzyme
VISVDPNFQGNNLGRIMVSQGLAALHKKGVNNAILFVDESNESARKLYSSLGFSLIREDKLVLFKN